MVPIELELDSLVEAPRSHTDLTYTKAQMSKLTHIRMGAIET